MADAGWLQRSFQVAFAAALVVAAVMDVRARRVPNLLCLLLLLTGFVAAALQLSATALGGAMLGTLVALAIWIPFWLMRLLGAGDVKFFAAACAWLGPSMAWRASLATAVLGGIMGTLLLVRERGVRRAMEFGAVGASNPAAVIRSATAQDTAPAVARTFPYAVPMAIVLAAAMFSPRIFG